MKANHRQFVSVFILFVLVFSQFAYPKPASAASIRYVVASGGLTSGPCDSWGAACTLTRGLASAASGDEVWVQQGTYKPGTVRTDTFTIMNGVAVYGGFLGTETQLSERNPDPANTILSGDIGDVDVYTDNSFHVVTIDNAGTSTLLDGFTVTRGYVTDADGNAYGAGVLVTNSSPTLNNLFITDNYAGNTVGSGGGGVYIDGPPTLPLVQPTISNVTFFQNYSGRGGGLFSQRSSPVLTNVVFEENEALGTGGGGANFQNLNPTDPYINPILTNVSFINNTATGGGGMFLGTSSGSLTNVTFSGNSARRRGGGLLLEFSTAVLTNVTFYNNVSQNLDTYPNPRGGGGIMNILGSPTLNNVTFNGNTSTANGVDGSGMRNTDASHPVIHNAIFWGDTSTEITSDNTGTITINDSIVQGGCPAFTGVTCTDVVNADPVLGALADNGGFTQTMALGTGSAAIDAGNNSTCAAADQRGVTRPQGTACDMGAYEVEAVMPSFTDTTEADFNAGTVGDCVVDNTIGDGAVRLNIPSSTSCVFVSQIFDAGDLVDWESITSTQTTPAQTSIVLEVRTGNTDGTWTGWRSNQIPLNNFGGQYAQYRATLSTTDSGQTPVLEDVTLNYVNKAYAVLQAPVGIQSDWDHVFSWTGRASATNYMLEVYKPDNSFVLWKWYTSAQAGCAGGTNCSITPAETLNLANGDYKWRVADYDTTDGYGIITNLSNFTLSGACYILAKDVSPSGSGAVNTSAVNCPGGYTAGTVVQVSVAPSAGYVFTGWSGDASGTSLTTTVTMDGNKSVTANLRGNTLLSPSGTLASWDNVFSWTGHAAATHYLLEVQKPDNTYMLYKWYTSAQTGCAGGTNCSISPAQLSGLANGDYKWRIRDYGSYGYGPFTPYMNFTLNP